MESAPEKGKRKNTETPLPKTLPNDPEHDIPVKQDDDNDFTVPKPSVKEPGRVDPTHIEEPNKVDPTRIDVPEEPGKEQQAYE